MSAVTDFARTPTATAKGPLADVFPGQASDLAGDLRSAQASLEALIGQLEETARAERYGGAGSRSSVT